MATKTKRIAAIAPTAIDADTTATALVWMAREQYEQQQQPALLNVPMPDGENDLEAIIEVRLITVKNRTTGKKTLYNAVLRAA